MPRLKLTRAAGPLTVALTALDLWQRLPKRQRRLIAQQVKKHGPRLARQAVEARLQKRRKP